MKESKKPEQFMLHCDFCGKKVTVLDPSNVSMTEIKVADTPGGSPYYDPHKKKTIGKPSTPRPKMFKCSQCGRGLVMRNNMTPKSAHEENKNEKDLAPRREVGPFGWPVS
jgi:hypothetical protein